MWTFLQLSPKHVHLEDAAAILSDSSVSTGPSESDGPSGSTAPTDPASLTRSNCQESQPHVFLSYQWDIKAKVIELKEKLEQKRFTCWMDDDEMGPGDKLRGEIENGISHCKVLTTFSKVSEEKKNVKVYPSFSLAEL